MALYEEAVDQNLTQAVSLLNELVNKKVPTDLMLGTATAAQAAATIAVAQAILHLAEVIQKGQGNG